MEANICPPMTTRTDDKRVAKPSIMSYLESETSCLSISHRLVVLEIIVFVFDVLKNNLKGNRKVLSLEELYLLIDRFMSRELKAIGDLDFCKLLADDCDCGQRQDKKFDNKLLFLTNFLSDFIDSQIISIDMSQRNVEFHRECRDDRLLAVTEMIDESVRSVLKTYLMTQLTKFGSKRIDFIEIKLIKDYNHLFLHFFSAQTSHNLLEWTQSMTNFFEVIPSSPCVVSARNTPLEKIGNNCRHYNRLVQRIESSDPVRTSLEGIVRLSRDHFDNCYIICENEESIRYEIDFNLIRIYGSEGNDIDLKDLIHNNDNVVFDARLDSNISTDDNNNLYRWTVTQITRITHLAKCYLPNEQQFSTYFTNA